jgi:hypothetical protein
LGVVVWAVLGLAGGCTPSAGLGRTGVELTPPVGWKTVAPTTWPVPGTPIAAWSGPGGASLVLYRSLPVPGGRAEALAEGLANRLENLPGLRVVSRGVETVGGLDAARVEAVAPGTGDALAPSGAGTPVAPEGVTLRPTRRVVLLVPRPADTLGLVWHAPEEDTNRLEQQVRSTLATVKIDRGRLTTSSY